MKSNREWLSISDMMAGLMMVFLFIAIVFMQQISREKESLVDIASAYAQTKISLNAALHKEFKDDLEIWGAEILTDNTFRFKEPDVLFARNSVEIRDRFQVILNNFFPRYIKILTSEEFKKDIIEVRIEGHTSSEWNHETSKEDAYLFNAHLSQGRAYSVLDYLFRLDEIKDYQGWLIKVFRANGLSFSRRFIVDGQEDIKQSRRVEFRVVTNTEERIEEILIKSSKRLTSL